MKTLNNVHIKFLATGFVWFYGTMTESQLSEYNTKHEGTIKAFVK